MCDLNECSQTSVLEGREILTTLEVLGKIAGDLGLVGSGGINSALGWFNKLFLRHAYSSNNGYDHQ